MIRDKIVLLWENPMILKIRYLYKWTMPIFFFLLIFSLFFGRLWKSFSETFPSFYIVVVFFMTVMSYLSVPVMIVGIVSFFDYIFYKQGEIVGFCWTCFCARRSDRIREELEKRK